METIGNFIFLIAFGLFLLGHVFGSNQLKSYGLGIFLAMCGIYALFN